MNNFNSFFKKSTKEGWATYWIIYCYANNLHLSGLSKMDLFKAWILLKHEQFESGNPIRSSPNYIERFIPWLKENYKE